MEVGFHASRIGIVAFIIPFMFVYGPALLLQGSALEIIRAAVTSLFGVWMLAGGVQGWLLQKAGWPERLLMIIGALMLIDTGLLTDMIGFVLAGSVIVWQLIQRTRSRSHSEVDVA